MTRDQFLTEMMGECWHETYWCAENYDSYKIPVENRNLSCKKCDVKVCDHPNFSTTEGFFKLWNFCKEQEWWEEFVDNYVIIEDSMEKIPEGYKGTEWWHRMLNWIINPDTFANAIACFKGWKVKE